MNQEEALKQIKLIREMVQKASERFLFSPWQWIEWGVLVIVGCLITYGLQRIGSDNNIIFLWIAIFIIGGALETYIWMVAARGRGVEPFNPFILKLWGVAFTIMVMAIILTFVFINLHQALYIPGLWLMTMGSVMVNFFIMAERKDMLLFGIVQMIGGILAVSFLLKYSLLVGAVFFGIGALIHGIYSLTKRSAK